ncbi:MAG TPA: hypothetical protein VJS64_20070 [Pyrinomonadaceae bacterium]|nr:hypothetical protein [Pyrinomonadaceae bacterium]
MAHNDHKENGHGHVTEIPDVSYIKNVDVTHETSDVNVPALLKFVLALTIMTAVVYILMLFLFKFLNAQEAQKEPPAGPMAMTEQESLPPEPRLQSAPGFGVKLENGQWVTLEKREPQAEYRVVRQQWLQSLTEGPKDQAGRSVGIPIDEAMQKFVAEQAAKTGESKRFPNNEGYGDRLPTAASSGRVAVKQ